MHAEPPSSSQIEDEYHALAAQAAKLDLEDQNIDPDLSSKDADDTWSDEEAPSETVDENTEPQPAHATASTPTDSVQADQNKLTEAVKNPANATASQDTNPSPSQDEEDDETSTPRFQTYVKLHNDVRHPPKLSPLHPPSKQLTSPPQMMTSKTALTSNPTELTNNYTHASRLARILLGSHEKHDDLPLVIHAQACLVLGCSDEDDCYERMEDAVFLLNHAMEEGVLDKERGGAMIETCELVMGMRGQRAAGSEDDDGKDDDEGEGENEGEEDGQGEGGEHEESKDEGADDGESIEKNDALP
jgi:hypothetical protein